MLVRALSRFVLLALAVVVTCCAGRPSRGGAPRAPGGHATIPFTVHRPEPGFAPPAIVLQYDPAAGTGADWSKVARTPWHDASAAALIGRAAGYLREALQKMTGRELAVESRSDLSRGIVLTLLSAAGPQIQGDPEVQRALAPDPADRYAANEAFFLRSERERVLVVANTADGLAAGVAELLESVDYEVLGLGPNWVHVPDFHVRPLAFAIRRAGRPSFYLRALTATSGQSRGVGTITGELSDPTDEPVTTSYTRWQIGTRTLGRSMPAYPGHALQAYHRDVLGHMRDTGVTEGFLSPKTVVAPAAQRPAPAPDNKGWLWIATDRAGPDASKAFVSDGKTWSAYDVTGPGGVPYKVDLSVPFVREILLRAMIVRATKAFEAAPDDDVIFPMEPEDGGRAGGLDALMAHKTWYPEYLASEGLPFGRPYALHGYAGLNQPSELWDPSSDSDNVFGCASWLLREFDKWVDALPPEHRVTATGKSKKDLIRCSFYSYGYHDVPPDFNIDARLRVMVAGYPKNRGEGKWEKLSTQEDVARAFKVMLPREPLADYRILSLSMYADPGPSGIPAKLETSAAAVAREYRRAYDAGYRAIAAEIDFNFGKSGLAYYLIGKMLWNADLTSTELDAIRDRWLARAFGSGWKEMKLYYDFMNPEGYPANNPNAWAKAIRFIDAADKKIDGVREPEAQRRVDDVKHFWYGHYLLDSGRYTSDSPELKEFLWKGQMSYMVAMHAILRSTVGTSDVRKPVGALSAGRAHYTRAEIDAWWPKVLEAWQPSLTTLFADTKLTDGRSARSVDLNDLVAVEDFQGSDRDAPFLYNSASIKPVPFLVTARAPGHPIGFKLSWPFNASDRSYRARSVPYGVEIWDAGRRKWVPWIDKSEAAQPSVPVITARGRVLQVVEVRLTAPRAGTYRFQIGAGGNLARLGSLGYDAVTDQYATSPGFTYAGMAAGLTQSPVFFYIPKSTKSVDLEVWDSVGPRFLHLYKGLPAANRTLSRKVDIGSMGTHNIALEPGEAGTVAMISGNGFAFPQLDSVPSLWAKSPAALLVPRAIAKADGLTILP